MVFAFDVTVRKILLLFSLCNNSLVYSYTFMLSLIFNLPGTYFDVYVANGVK